MTEGGSDNGPARNFRSAYYEKLGFCGNDEKNYLDLLIEASPFDSEKLHDLCERPELDRKCIEAWKILLGVECGRDNNPFDEYANIKRVRSEHFQLLKHHLEVLLKHNHLLIKTRLKSTQNEDQPSATPTKDDAHDTHQQSQQQHLSTQPDDGQQRQHSHADSRQQENNRVSNNHDARLITLMYLLEAGRLDTLETESQLKSVECRQLLAMATFFVNVAADLQEAFFLFRNFTNHIRNKPKS